MAGVCNKVIENGRFYGQSSDSVKRGENTAIKLDFRISPCFVTEQTQTNRRYALDSLLLVTGPGLEGTTAKVSGGTG